MSRAAGLSSRLPNEWVANSREYAIAPCHLRLENKRALACSGLQKPCQCLLSYARAFRKSDGFIDWVLPRSVSEYSCERILSSRGWAGRWNSIIALPSSHQWPRHRRLLTSAAMIHDPKAGTRTSWQFVGKNTDTMNQKRLRCIIVSGMRRRTPCRIRDPSRRKYS